MAEGVSDGRSEARSGFGAYVRLLREPGAPALAFWGVVGRFPIGMRPLGVVLLLSSGSGSLSAAGVVAGAMLLAQGLASPVLGRLADRYSQRRVLIGAGLAHAAGMALLVVTALRDAPLWVLIATALVPGCTSVSFTSFMRARWTAMVDQGTLRTAFAMESVLDDTIFLLGPLLVTALATAVHPAAGLVACLLLTAFGSLAVALHHRSEPASKPADGSTPRRAIGVPGVWVMMFVYAGMGFQFGALDITLVAFADEHAKPGLAGVLLSLTAVGSLVAGLLFGAVNWRRSPVQLLLITSGVLTLSAVPLAFASSALVMLFLAVVAGIAIAPAMITGSTVLESLAPRGSLSEAFSLLTSTGASGIAAGTAVGGQLAGISGFSTAAWATAGGGLLALVLAVAGRPALRPRSDAATAPQASAPVAAGLNP